MQGAVETTETTTVYVEGKEADGPVQIMDMSIYFEMEFATIQQLGFDKPADAFKAAMSSAKAGSSKPL